VSGLILEVAEAGPVNSLSILGPIINHWAYEPRPRGWDSGPLAQAALLVPGGIGVVIWDSEEYAELRRATDGLEAEATARFVPFAACEPAVKGLLLPTIEPLLEQLADKLP
jgi:hypothetical protein